jgi:acyl carrier protein
VIVRCSGDGGYARERRYAPLPLDSRPFFRYEAKTKMATDIPSEVKRIIKEQLDVDEKDIKPESSFIDDLGADSLGLVELVLAFEEAFEIDIPDEDTEKIRTVQDAIDYIEKHAKK